MIVRGDRGGLVYMTRMTRPGYRFMLSPWWIAALAGGVACGDPDGSADAGDTSAVDIVFGDLGVSSTSDTRSTETDDPVDTTVTDTTFDATTVTDTTVTDTTVDDTTVTDTTVTDTTVTDTTVTDATVTDTTVTDATVTDTTGDEATVVDVADTSEPACQIGGCETDMAPAGNTCASAWIIGRPNAQAGFGHASSTVGAGNDSDFPQAACGDSGPDRFYRIYLKVGEQLWVNANPSPVTYDLTFGLYRGAACETPITCVDNDVDQTTPDTMPYQAVVEGWHTLVVDGRGSQGAYTIVVTLDCHEDDCCCR